MGLGFLEAAQDLQVQADVVKDQGVVGEQRQQLQGVFEGLLVVLVFPIGAQQEQMDVGIVGKSVNQPVETADGFRVLALLDHHLAQQVDGLGLPGLKFQSLAEGPFGFAELLHFQKPHGLKQQGRDKVRLQEESPVEQRHHAVDPIGLKQGQGKQVVGFAGCGQLVHAPGQERYRLPVEIPLYQKAANGQKGLWVDLRRTSHFGGGLQSL